MAKTIDTVKTSLFGYSKKSVDDYIADVSEQCQEELKTMKAEYEEKINNIKYAFNRDMRVLEETLEKTRQTIDPLLKENADLKMQTVSQKRLLEKAESQVNSVSTQMQANTVNKTAMETAIAQARKKQEEYAHLLYMYNDLKSEAVKLSDKARLYEKENKELKILLEAEKQKNKDFTSNTLKMSNQLLSASSQFDEKLTTLKQCAVYISTMCNEAEEIFNGAFLDSAEVLLSKQAPVEEETENIEEKIFSPNISLKKQVS